MVGLIAPLCFIALGATMVNELPLVAVGSIIAGAVILHATGLVQIIVFLYWPDWSDGFYMKV